MSVAIASGVIAPIVLILALVASGERSGENVARISYKVFKGLMVTLGLALFFSLVPSTDQLFRIRLNLIKFELASPDNVKKGTEEIANIAKKLECKYLGCEETKPIPKEKSEK